MSNESWRQFGVAAILIHELTHVYTVTPRRGGYGHLDMALAAQKAAGGLGIDVKSALMLNFPTPDKYKTQDAFDTAASNYYNRVIIYACRKVRL